MIVIPAIDLRGGRCVRLLRGEFDQETNYSDNPAAIAREFADLAVSRLHIVDLDGARDGSQQNQKLVHRIAAESPLRIQVGGGIRDSAALTTWFDAGVDRCVVGSLAVTEPDIVMKWFAEYGAERIVLALDIRLGADAEPMIATHGWRQTSSVSLWQCMERYLDYGLKHVLCTDVSRDGAMSGPNVRLYREVLSRYPTLELQASGGVRGIDDLRELRTAGVPAAITGRALLDGSLTAEELKSFRHDA